MVILLPMDVMFKSVISLTEFGGDYTYCDNATQEIIIDISINCAYNDEIPTMSESAARLHCDTVYLCQSNGQFLVRLRSALLLIESSSL